MVSITFVSPYVDVFLVVVVVVPFELTFVEVVVFEPLVVVAAFPVAGAAAAAAASLPNAMLLY